MVTCDPPRNDVYEALEPRMVVEVLSPSNTGVAWERKLDEYRQHQQLDYLLLLDSRCVAATLYVRSATGWDGQNFDTLKDTIQLPNIECKLALAKVYAGTDLKPLPTVAKD